MVPWLVTSLCALYTNKNVMKTPCVLAQFPQRQAAKVALPCVQVASLVTTTSDCERNQPQMLYLSSVTTLTVNQTYELLMWHEHLNRSYCGPA